MPPKNVLPWIILALAMVVTTAAYWPGVYGGFLFDDFPNIVDNSGVQPLHADLANLVRAALSSPASDFKRPLASLSFALNFLATGLSPMAMKVTNLVIHLVNGLLVFLLTRLLITAAHRDESGSAIWAASHRGEIAALVAGAWLLLPINITAVLYVVQRMESLANLFVLTGLIGYVSTRLKMCVKSSKSSIKIRAATLPVLACMAWMTIPALIGVCAKETAVMLPLYALAVESALFRFRCGSEEGAPIERKLVVLYCAVLVVPLIIGLGFILPPLLSPTAWASRDFTMVTRLLSEARIVTEYISWTLLPTPSSLSFYHDDFLASTSLFSPWTTFGGLISLAILTLVGLTARHRPLVALGIWLFLGCHLLTGTVLPLELIYEHRNYFASFGLMLVVIPVLVEGFQPAAIAVLAWPRRIALAGIASLWIMLTVFTAAAWSSSLSLANELALRAPRSPRAQYELGRAYIIASEYREHSQYVPLANSTLERAAALPSSTVLPEQGLIFMNARMHLPVKDEWWKSMTAKLRAKPPGIQDESALESLSSCFLDQRCRFDPLALGGAFDAARAHGQPSARLNAIFADFAWNGLHDRASAREAQVAAVALRPREPNYLITLIRFDVALGLRDDARARLTQLISLNIGGSLDGSIRPLRQQVANESRQPAPSPQ